MCFPIALSCTSGENNCDLCNDDNTACYTCHARYAADTNGVCQGNLSVHTVLLPYQAITYITVLSHFPITRFRPFGAFDVQEICIFGDLHAELLR